MDDLVDEYFRACEAARQAAAEGESVNRAVAWFGSIAAKGDERGDRLGAHVAAVARANVDLLEVGYLSSSDDD